VVAVGMKCPTMLINYGAFTGVILLLPRLRRRLPQGGGPRSLSGRAQQVLPDDAIAGGDAFRISAFFRSFLAEARGTQASSSAYGRARSSTNGPI
jgi:hypothetical protein